tara:strand:+ start:295 stop:1074 length:780 start_codon:yes stop_codon:yes gene_type:complete
MNIIDSHCHLDYEPMYSNLDNVIKRAHESNIKYMLTISVKDDKYDNILSITKKFTNVYGTYGIHPHEAKNHNKINKEIILKKIKMSDKIIGIGETGLDFYYNHSDENDQIRLFEEHIKASIESSLPIIIHSRNAENSTYDILAKYSKKSNLKILMHCFTGSKKFAEKLLNLDAYFSASGIITFKNSNDLKETFKSIPLEKVLIETDAPYLSPEPLRGKSNEPSNIVYTAKFLANLKNVEFNTFCEKTTKNFLRLFGSLN